MMNKMLISACGSIAYAEFAHKKQLATHWPLQHKKEMKVIHIAQISSLPIYSTTLVGENKLLVNRLRSQLLLSSDYSLRSYSSNGKSIDYLLPNPAYSEPDMEEACRYLLYVALMVIGGIILAPKFDASFRHGVTYFGITGLPLVLAFRRLGYLIQNLYLHFKKLFVKETTRKVMMKKARAQCCICKNKIPFEINDNNTKVFISDEIENMLLSHPTVPKVSARGHGPCSCFNRVLDTLVELTFACKIESKEYELYEAEHDIVLQAVRIIRQNGAEPDSSSVDY